MLHPHSWICLITREAVQLLTGCLGLRASPTGVQAARWVSTHTHTLPQSFWKHLLFEEWGTWAHGAWDQLLLGTQWLLGSVNSQDEDRGFLCCLWNAGPTGMIGDTFSPRPSKGKKTHLFSTAADSFRTLSFPNSSLLSRSQMCPKVPGFMWASDYKSLPFKRDVCSALLLRYCDGNNLVVNWLCLKIFRFSRSCLWVQTVCPRFHTFSCTCEYQGVRHIVRCSC